MLSEGALTVGGRSYLVAAAVRAVRLPGARGADGAAADAGAGDPGGPGGRYADAALAYRADEQADIAVALAEAGNDTQARERVDANLSRWPDDFSVRMRAGDALAALGDLDAAETHFRAALRQADDLDDFESRVEVMDSLERLRRRQRAGPNRSAGQRTQPKRKRSRKQRKR